MQKKKLKYIILGTVAAIALGLIILAISMILEFCSTGEGKGEVVLIEVEQGEGVWDIAKKYNASPAELMNINSLSETVDCDKTILISC